MIPLSTRFNDNTLVESFDELKYFTSITSLSAIGNSWCFKRVNLKNITTASNSVNNNYILTYNLPNLKTKTGTSSCFYIGTYVSTTNSTSKAYFFPKLESWAGNFQFQWYSRGTIRWIVLGIDNGNKIVSVGGTSSSQTVATRTKGIFVPDAMVDSYKADTYWSKWSSYIHSISEFKSLVTDVTGEELPEYEYSE